MKSLLRWLVILGVLGVILGAASVPLAGYLKERNKVVYREAEVTRGKITAVVNATGTVKPVELVPVGAFVSGPIKKISKDFNDLVKTGDALAEIDTEIYDAAVARDKANLATREAEIGRVQVQLLQAQRNEGRGVALRKENKSFISEVEMDQLKFSRMVLEAELTVAESLKKQAKANLTKSEADLGYTIIKSPVDGIIIERKILKGQTVASSFQTPELFVVAPDLKKMHVFASVDEADIGLLEEARKANYPVRFTVDSFPDDLFEGAIFQIRKNATTMQNVVTYPVVVLAQNVDLKLMPSMTASLSFQVRETGSVLKIPNGALRFYPQREQVRPEDREILESKAPSVEVDDGTTASSSAEDKAAKRRLRNRRHVWVAEGNYLKAVEVITGLSDNNFTEMVSGQLREGDKLVTGVQGRN